MGKNDNGGNKYDTNKRFSEDDRKKEKRIKNPVGNKRSSERNALKKAVSIFTTKGYLTEDSDDELFDDLQE